MHLGAKPDAGNAYSQNREQELWDSFRDIMTICNQKKTDLLLIAGDLFHRQPLLRELKEMNSILEMLEHTEVVMIAGNHDYIKKNSYYRTFSWAPHVHMICSQEIDCVELDRIQTAVYGCSYHSREIHDPVYDHAVPEGRQKYEILLAHGGDEKHIPIKSNQIMTLGYDYVGGKQDGVCRFAGTDGYRRYREAWLYRGKNYRKRLSDPVCTTCVAGIQKLRGKGG